MSEARTVEAFLGSSQDARADLLTRWTLAWVEGAPFASSLSALLQSSMESSVRLQQIDNLVSTTLVSLLLEQGTDTRAGVGAAVAAAQFLAIHPTGSRLQELLCDELRSQADTAQIHGAIALLARQQARQGAAAGGMPQSIAMDLLESRIADFAALPTGARQQLQQEIFADIEALKGQLPISPYFGLCTAAFAHTMLQPQAA